MNTPILVGDKVRIQHKTKKITWTGTVLGFRTNTAGQNLIRCADWSGHPSNPPGSWDLSEVTVTKQPN